MRTLLRWTHVGCALALIGWLYTPLVNDAFATMTARFLLVPFLALTGIAMWARVGASSGR